MKMFVTRLVLFLTVIHHGLSTKSYYIQLNDVDLNTCENDNVVFDILSFNLWSNELEIPGFLDCTLSFYLKKDYSAVYASYTIKIERKLGPMWVHVPCMNDYCSEQSLCTTIKNSCSSMKSCNRNCQLSPGSHTLDHISIPLKLHGLQYDVLTNGEYKFKVKFFDPNKTPIGCFNGYVTLRKK